MSAQIMLSTFNGEAFLEAQLDSLLEQDFSAVDIIIRDDGSTDRTPQILLGYSTIHRNIHVSLGRNIGYVKSFFTLLAQASPDADFFAFCDQDDIWMSDKVSCAVEFLQERPSTIPLAVCGGATIVNSELGELGQLPPPRKPLSFLNALVECPLLGCTLVINRATRELLLRAVPERAYSHDWWVYLLVSAFGEILYDPRPRLLYRQHPANYFGSCPQLSLRRPFQCSTLLLRQWQQSLLRFLRQGSQQMVMQQAREFHHIYRCLLPSNCLRELEHFLGSQDSLLSRIDYAWRGSAHRHSAFSTLIMKLLVAAKRL
ncbi:MAG: glycosyltransferase family 2 protein [Synechococcus sp.]|nr:glycosyltransferase family 2 protein [Synechococcus sp.]